MQCIWQNLLPPIPCQRRASSCLTCTTLSLWQKLLYPCRDNLEKAQGTSLPELEKLHNSWHDPAVIVPTHHCTCPAVLQAGSCGWICHPRAELWGCGCSQGWVGVHRQPLDGLSLSDPTSGHIRAWSSFPGERKRIRKTYKLENIKKKKVKLTPCKRHQCPAPCGNE